jgi:hypothetical protein
LDLIVFGDFSIELRQWYSKEAAAAKDQADAAEALKPKEAGASGKKAKSEAESAEAPVNDRDTKKEEKKEPPKKKKPSDSSEESDIEDGKSKAVQEPTKHGRETATKPSTSSEAPARPSSSRFSDRSSDRPGPDRPVSSGPDRPGSTSTSAPDRPGPTRPGSISSIGNKSP